MTPTKAQQHRKRPPWRHPEFLGRAPYVQGGLYASVEIHDWQFGGRPPSSLTA
jgi:hypothetical protein